MLTKSRKLRSQEALSANLKRLAVESLETRYLLTAIGIPSTNSGEFDPPLRIENSYEFSATAGTLYSFNFSEALDGTLLSIADAEGNRLAIEALESRINWLAPADGDFALIVTGSLSSDTTPYTFDASTVTYADDHGSYLGTATELSSPLSAGGEIEVPGDVDVFEFEAKAGALYRFQSSRHTIALYGPNGESLIDGSNNPDWIAPTNGNYFVQISGSSGEYTLNIEENIYEDDHGSFPDLATPIAAPTQTPGVIEVEGDVDFMSFTATAGVLYHISTTNADEVATSLRILDTDGTTQLGFDGGSDTSSFIPWVAPESSTYFFRIVGDSGAGAYELGVEAFDYVDDHSNIATDATEIESSSSSTTVGQIDTDADVDMFSFKADAGSHFTFDLDAESPASLSLFSTDGTTLLRSFVVRPGSTLDPFIEWTATQSGNYFVAVSDIIDDSVGPYDLAMQQFMAGDADRDRDVDSDDLGLLLNSFGNPGFFRWEAGDMNNDGTVDSTDLGLMLNRFGESDVAATSATAIPDIAIEQTPTAPRAALPTSRPAVADASSHRVAAREFVFAMANEDEE